MEPTPEESSQREAKEEKEEKEIESGGGGEQVEAELRESGDSEDEVRVDIIPQDEFQRRSYPLEVSDDANRLIEMEEERGSDGDHAEGGEEVQSNQRVQLRRVSKCKAVWFTLVNVALITALIIDGKHTCEGYHLKKWATVIVILQGLLMIVSSILKWKRPNEHDQQRGILQPFAPLYVISRLLTTLWVVWIIVGFVWIFQAKPCNDVTPVLYTTCFILAICHLCLIGIPILIFCCSIPVIIGLFICCPDLTNQKQRPASTRLIKSKTTVKKYSEELGIAKANASCAICLSDYEIGEKLRFLPCGHHFHGDCIIQWLTRNKVCPYCKHPIDEKYQKTEVIVDSGDELEEEDGGGGGEEERERERERKEEVEEIVTDEDDESTLVNNRMNRAEVAV